MPSFERAPAQSAAALRRFAGSPDSVITAIAASAPADGPVAETCWRLLAPVFRADEDRGTNLVATLRTYYACGASVVRTAQALFLHRNSVRYRLDRVRCLLRCDIDRPHAATALIVALAVADRHRTDLKVRGYKNEPEATTCN
ncbi:MAG: helix-turn-helix domain-containing protein [Candidatus Eremiobacteraeota bacterium]|nr:helix-turn-helix domain-containing protein [Candidatus Eremiobacteraeota bacterium]MBC5826297.1 helix-turn-helix domain-containing protein [Candidatus Eremiobacteraeota bacterium]